jgi:hypothetical protein
MLPVGTAALVLGIVVFVFSGCGDCEGESLSRFHREVLAVGLPLTVGGAALVAGGIVAIVGNRTKLEFARPMYGSSPRFELGGFAIGPEGLRF